MPKTLRRRWVALPRACVIPMFVTNGIFMRLSILTGDLLVVLAHAKTLITRCSFDIVSRIIGVWAIDRLEWSSQHTVVLARTRRCLLLFELGLCSDESYFFRNFWLTTAQYTLSDYIPHYYYILYGHMWS